MILSAQSIRRLCVDPFVQGGSAMIASFSERTVDPVSGMSWGLSSCGYDVRLDAGMIYPNRDAIYDWHGKDEWRAFIRHQSGEGVQARVRLSSDDQMVLPPRSFVLAATMEHFSLPLDVCMVVRDKSSWARRGVFMQNTVAEPGWRGWLTLEISNDSHGPIVLFPGCPIAQVMFERLDEPTTQPYPETGKYQNQQRGAQLSRMEKP